MSITPVSIGRVLVPTEGHENALVVVKEPETGYSPEGELVSHHVLAGRNRSIGITDLAVLEDESVLLVDAHNARVIIARPSGP